MLTKSQIVLHSFRNSWKYILSVILILPILKWLTLMPLDARFGSFASYAKAFGQAFGIIGTLLFSFSLLLSFRNRFTETLFGGLDTLYRIHHKAGMYGLFLLLLHPLLLSIPKILFSVEDAMTFFIPFQTSAAVDFGIFSILAFMFLIGITLFGVIFSYEGLKRFHQFLGVAFLLGAIHGFMIPSDIQEDVFIRLWVLGFAFLGILSYIYYSLFKKVNIRKNLYKVASLSKVGGGITEVALTPVGAPITHLPGQFSFFSFKNSLNLINHEPHPFTISSWTGTGEISLSAKALGDFTTAIPEAVVGELVEIEGPFGEFSYLFGNTKQVWVAGGVGVTPFVSFARHALKNNSFPFEVDFYYSVRTKDDLAYHELFTTLSEHFSSFVYHPMPSDTAGYITGELLVGGVQDILTRDIFICGPPPMMNGLMSSLTSLGVKKKYIHSELFSLLK